MTPIALADCPSLIAFLLTADDVGMAAVSKGATCSVERIGRHAHFEFVSPDFGLSVVVPGWYVGEHGEPAYIVMVGDPFACLWWLPIERADKCALIERLPFDEIDKTLLTVAV